MRRALLILLAVALGACSGGSEGLPEVEGGRTIEVSGPFEPGGAIPGRFTCEGSDESPALRWEGIPDAASYVVVMHDLDADDFVHWVAWGIGPEDTELAAGEVPSSAVEGTNSFGETGYSGPCPPPGDEAHTYEFTVYALGGDEATLDESAEAADVLDAIESSVIGSGRLRGTYDR